MHTQTKFEVIPDLLTEGFEDLDDNDFNHKFDTEFRGLKKELYNTVCMSEIVNWLE